MNNCKITELNQKMYQIKIKHVREFIGVERKDDDEFMTKWEYETARLNDELIYSGMFTDEFYADQGVAHGKMPTYGKAVSPTGGWTEVTITTPLGRVRTAKHSFYNKCFCRKLGVRAALSKTMFQLSVECQRRADKKNAPFACGSV